MRLDFPFLFLAFSNQCSCIAFVHVYLMFLYLIPSAETFPMSTDIKANFNSSFGYVPKIPEHFSIPHLQILFGVGITDLLTLLHLIHNAQVFLIVHFIYSIMILRIS